MAFRLLLIVEPGLNGVFRHVEGLCDYFLACSDICLGLAYSDVRGSDALPLLVERVRQRGGPVLNLRVDNLPSIRDVAAQSGLIRLITDFAPHVIHSHSSKAGGLARGLWAMNVSSVQFYTPNAYFGLNRKPSLKTSFFNGIESILGRIGYTINVSNSERRFALRRLGLSTSALLSIPNAVDCTRFFPATAMDRIKLRVKLGLPEAAWVFGSVGRYSAQKDPHTLYKAVEQVLRQDTNAWFAHLGEGEAFDEIGGWLCGHDWSRRVVRVRYSSQPSSFYRALDAFVLSSRFEGLPISGIEALATGLPLIFTQCPGCEDFAHMGLNGIFWGGIERPETLAKALLESRLLRVEAINHRAVAERCFSPDAVYGSISSAYRRAVREQIGIVV